MNKNIILFGPPGTGKTYKTVLYAVSICDNVPLVDLEQRPYNEVLNRYNELKDVENRVAFTTFHQSYGYEEFIEGIRPVIEKKGADTTSGDVKYEFSDGVFKDFCNRAKEVTVKAPSKLPISSTPRIWSVLLDGTGMSDLKEYCFANDCIKIGWHKVEKYVNDETAELSDKARKILINFQEEMQIGDIVLIQKSRTSIDAIGIVAGPYEWDANYEHFPRTRKVVWVKTGIDLEVKEMNQDTGLDRKSVYELTKMDVSEVIELIKKVTITSDIIVQNNKKPYVFIIDEINRGNISKIFGELITLIEETKRKGAAEAASAILPYTKDAFSVPNNVYILGTMNTADRSIALMDTALRRRFEFVEMMPQASALTKLGIDDIEGVDLPVMLRAMNERIEYLYDREHMIGHAYFTGLKDDPNIKNLASIFKNAIIPLLQEYFYEDYNKIQLVLGDNAKSEDRYKFILDEEIKVKSVFKGTPDIDLPEKKYSIQEDAFLMAESYKQIY